MKKFCTFFLAVLFFVGAKAQIVYDGATGATTNQALVTASTLTAGNPYGSPTLISSASACTLAGSSGGNNYGTAVPSATTTPANGSYSAAVSPYFEFTLTPTQGRITITSIVFNSRSTTTGPQKYDIRTSVDAYTSAAVTGNLANNGAWASNSSTGLNIIGAPVTAVTVRIYAYGGTGNANVSTSNWRIDDLTIGATVPVTYTSFTASRCNEGTNLTWLTATELNNAHFDIERSTNGTAFTKIGEVKGNGTTNAATKYSFVDANAANGINYYRLNQVDINGASEFSKIITVLNGKGKDAVKFYPTLANNTLNVDYVASANAALTITDFAGRVVLTQALAESNAVSTQAINIENLTSGLYFASFEVNGTRTVERFSKN